MLNEVFNMVFYRLCTFGLRVDESNSKQWYRSRRVEIDMNTGTVVIEYRLKNWYLIVNQIGRMKAVVHELLKQYLVVESQFQDGHYDKCVSVLREKNKDNMAAVVATIFSHSQTTKKNMLVTQLIDHLWSHEPGLTDELASILKELTMLNRSENAKVALRARQVPFIHISIYLLVWVKQGTFYPRSS